MGVDEIVGVERGLGRAIECHISLWIVGSVHPIHCAASPVKHMSVEQDVRVGVIVVVSALLSRNWL